MHKRIFMLGDSHIWGTEQTAPDGKICEYPPRIYTKINSPGRITKQLKNTSILPSETTFPYYLDDWKETVNLGWPGAGIDTTRDRFIHKVFDILEPDDVVVMYLPTGNRTSFGMNLGSNFNDPMQSDLYLNGNDIKDYAVSPENITKVGLNWHQLFKTSLGKMYKTPNKYQYNVGTTDREKRHLKILDDMNETELKVLFNNVDTFLNLTLWNQSTKIYNVINTIITIHKLANSKNNSNIFFVCDESVVDENKGNHTIKNIKKALGEDINSRILQWNWNGHIKNYLMHKNKIKDSKLWIHKYGHFTKQAHQVFAESIKDKFDRLLNVN